MNLMEQDPDERERVLEELDRVATAGSSNVHFLKRPLMVKNIIQLIIDKKVDIKKTDNSSQIYFMLVLNNLDFHTDEKSSFTELDPPEDHEYLLMTIKMCQQQVQAGGSGDINAIKGIQRNTTKGQCFETKALGEKVQIPMEFVKKLGIFEIRKEDNITYLDVIHLSYMEFCCAASLCRNDVDIQHELSKIKDNDRYKAVVIYMAGMFTRNEAIGFLNSCRGICQNFLDMLGNEEREKSIQDVFLSIMKRNEWMGADDIQLLREATAAAAEKIDFNLEKVSLPEVKDWKSVEDLMKLQQMSGLEQLKIAEAECKLEELDDGILNVLAASSNWEVGSLTLAQYGQDIMRKMSGRRLESLHIDWADCCRDSAVTALPSLLAAATEWRVDTLRLSGVTAAHWAALAREAGRGSIRSVRVSEGGLRRAGVEDIQAIWAATEAGWGDGAGRQYAKKSEGAAGLRELLKRAGKLTFEMEEEGEQEVDEEEEEEEQEVDEEEEEEPVSRRKCLKCIII